jgi:hypothetical protein
VSRADLRRRLQALEKRVLGQAEPLLVWVDQGEDVALRLEQTRVLHPARMLVAMRWQAPEASRL